MIYCLSHNNDERKQTIQRIFKNQNRNVKIYNGVDYTDPRIQGRDLNPNTKRCWSMMYGHLDMIQMFLNTTQEHGIFCEDDIIIRKDFGANINQFIHNFIELKLDILLLGYLCSNHVHGKFANFKEKPTNSHYKYYDYNANLDAGVWGAQMYMLSRKSAEFIINKYAIEYADRTMTDPNLPAFSPDWTITKEGNKAMIWPIVAIEDGKSQYEDEGQAQCRRDCFALSYSTAFL